MGFGWMMDEETEEREEKMRAGCGDLCPKYDS